jgi:hypothetical protein
VDEQDTEATHYLSSWRSALALQDVDIERNHAIKLEFAIHTIKPGLYHYDIGDCLRSCCNVQGENANDIDKVRFDVDVCEAILTGYINTTSGMLNSHDYMHIPTAIKLLPFELGMRFVTDYMRGNQYFSVSYPEENLLRAEIQFRLLESINDNLKYIGALVNKITSQHSR